jgi:predicted peptidase
MILQRRNRLCLTGLSIAFILSILSPLPAYSAQKTDSGLVQRAVQSNGRTCPFEVFVPPGWNAHKKWPVILFLHGVGHRLNLGESGIAVSVGQRFMSYQNQKEAIVVFPRCYIDEYWTQPNVAAVALQALAAAAREFHGDAKRTYLVGLSMGGFGTWYIASRNPGEFAALVVVCGGIRTPEAVAIPAVSSEENPYEDTARKLSKVPVWIFHGDKDDTIPVSESRLMASALRALGAKVRFTEYPGVGHNAWDKAFAEPEFFPWLLAQKLNSEKRSSR